MKPPGWLTAKLGEVAPRRDAPMPPATARVWNLSLEDIEGGSGRVLARQESRVSELGSAKCSFDERHVLYSKLRPYLNKVVVPDGRGVGTSELLPLLPDPLRLDREYLSFFLRSPDFVDFATANARGANLPRVAMDALWEREVPLPPLSEQRRIVARIKECMERIGEMRALKEEAAREAAALPAAARYEAFGECDHQMPLAQLIAEGPTNGLYKHSQFYGEGTPILRINNFDSGDVFEGGRELKRLRVEEVELERFRLRSGDIVLNRVNGSLDVLGKSCLISKLDEKTVFESNMMRFTVDRTKADPRYIVHFLASPQCREQLKAKARVIQQASVNQKDIGSLVLPLPSMSEQQAIAEALDHLCRLGGDAAREQQDSITSTKVLPAAVLRKAFAGEL